MCLAARYLSNTARAPGVRVIYLLHCRVCTYTATAGCRHRLVVTVSDKTASQSRARRLNSLNTPQSLLSPPTITHSCFDLSAVTCSCYRLRCRGTELYNQNHYITILTISIEVLRLTLNNGTEQTVFVFYRYIY